MKRMTLLLFSAAALLQLAGCASERYARPSQGEVQRGLASWYGPKFHGRPTASGEIYDMHGLTAAHRELPLGTVISVKNLDNDKTVQVRVNDRGPFVRGRVLDLSYGAAQELGMVELGLAKVEIRVVSVGEGAGGPNRFARYTVQVGAFRELENARSTRAKLAGIAEAEIQSSPDGWHRVRVGVYTSRSEADEVERELRRQGFDAAVVQLK